MFNSKEEILEFIARRGGMDRDAALAYADWRIMNEDDLVLTPDDQELNLATNLTVKLLRDDNWYCREEHQLIEDIREYDASEFSLFRDAKRSSPTVHGRVFKDSIEYRKLVVQLRDKSLSPSMADKLRNNALIDFLVRVYQEENDGQMPPPGLIENIINNWHQSLMGSFKFAPQLTFSFYGFVFPQGHTKNNISYIADLTMNNQGAYLESILDVEAVRPEEGEQRYYALPGNTHITSRFALEDEQGFQLKRVEFGSALLKKLSLQCMVDKEDFRGFKLLKARGNEESALRELRLLKYQRMCSSKAELQNLLLIKYTQAYEELDGFLQDRSDAVAVAARKVMLAVEESKREAGASAPLFLLKETLERVKIAVHKPTFYNLEQCNVLSQTLREPRHRMVTNALTDFVRVTTVVIMVASISIALLPVLTLASVPLAIGFHLAGVKSPASLLSKMSLFCDSLKKNATSNALDEFTKKASPPRQK